MSSYDHLDELIQQQLSFEFAYLFTREIRRKLG